MTFQMATKRSRRPRSEKEATIADGWRKSKLSESAISSLVGHRLRRPRSVVQWFSAKGHDRAYERVAETVIFKSFVEHGLGIPVCDFLRGLLFFWGIQLHHLTPTSILHISIFVHLCEVFLGIYPHFDLFNSLFFLNPYPNFLKVATVGGANLELRSEMAGKYIPYTPRRQIGDWRAEWFYIDNHAPLLPDRVPGPPKHCHEWFRHGYIQV